MTPSIPAFGNTGTGFSFGATNQVNQNSQTNSSGNSGFSFGGGNTNNVNNTPATQNTGFSFGNNNNNASASTTGSTFQFGQNNSSNGAAASKPAFTFGGNSAPLNSNSNSNININNSNNSGSKPAFTFGGVNSSANSNTSNANTSSGFSFGTSGSTKASTPAGGFNFSNATNKPSTPTASSGSTPAPALNLNTPRPTNSTGTFTFGNLGTDQTKPVPSFSLGNSSNQGTGVANKPTAEKPNFSFGNTSNSSNPSSTSGPSLNFGSVAGKTASLPTGISANPSSNATSSAPPKAAFSFGQGGSKPTSFSLGGQAPKDVKGQAVSFGLSKPESSDKPAAPLGGFSFGAKKGDTSSASGTSNGSRPAFHFSASGSTTPTASVNKDDNAKPQFSFSAGKKDEKKPAGFSFGPKLGSAAGSSAPKKEENKSAFTFGDAPTSKTEEAKPSKAAKPTEDSPKACTSSEKKQSFETNASSIAKAPVKLEDFKPKQISIDNKNLEDLINKWTNQLSSSSKVFGTYSDKIKAWDEVMVSSSEKISKLYSNSLKCEEKQNKIDQTLSYIEKQQEELDALLSGYERQSESLLASIHQSGGSVAVSTTVSATSDASTNNGSDLVLTNDQVRERSYKLAEILEMRLGSLGTNFSSLISEVNEVNDSFNRSLLLSNTKDSDEEGLLEDVLKLLNSHLESLSWIEQSEKSLNEQVERLKKATA
ncbi:DEKNAAC104701 [Brettanomyces naardenensis]|uniref:Nucleoporin NSP1 n=1 Tax=Brettanomyces naardenensis TaxID=13370 RepID=A0A448YRI8_BRENA|nr:DEKNAAC104701 [Brettanomyces naardenensis]